MSAGNKKIIFRLENDTDGVVPQVSKDFFVSLQELFCELLFENYTPKELIAYINTKHSMTIGYQHFLGDFLLVHANKNNIDLGLKIKYTAPLLPLQYPDRVCHIDKEKKPQSEATSDIDNLQFLKRTHSENSSDRVLAIPQVPSVTSSDITRKDSLSSKRIKPINFELKFDEEKEGKNLSSPLPILCLNIQQLGSQSVKLKVDEKEEVSLLLLPTP